MNITIVRPPIQDVPYTIGEMYIDDVFFCHTLEDYDRGLFQTDTLQYIESIKIKHETAIPYGTYQLIMSFSNRFQKFLPELLSVPGFGGIRIHPGNTQIDTSGCVLVGVKSGNKVLNSKSTYSKLQTLIVSRAKKEKIFVTIKQQ